MGNEQHGKDFEAQVRELMAEDAYTIRPSSAPYPAIRRQGTTERRRRVAAAGAVLVALAAAPVAAYALNGNGGDGSVNTAAPLPSADASPGTTPTPVQSKPVGPAGPATPGQLLDGITLAQASDGLEKCIALDHKHQEDLPPETRTTDLGDADDYRIILALNSTGDSNAPGDGIYVVAVRQQANQQQTRVICDIVDGKADGINTSGEGLELDNGGPAMADMNAGKLYQQSYIDKGNWKLPFRWGTIGRFESNVARVAVSYGGSTSEAALDHGWFVASGTLNKQVTLAPHVKGYDNTGKVVYDSDNDSMYEKTLP
ncbi:hypothetical protein [Streptomyces sp. SID12488]|uniref:hypothetical protein n=1 Tax=Streptomyces sp. SID12488 TaxID=2706040 RepID=UPI0013D9358F|nr:hypothetical protein [Streptomyces sp. SID12488]